MPHLPPGDGAFAENSHKIWDAFAKTRFQIIVMLWGKAAPCVSIGTLYPPDLNEPENENGIRIRSHDLWFYQNFVTFTKPKNLPLL